LRRANTYQQRRQWDTVVDALKEIWHLPVYAAWAWIVVLVFPPLFSYV
jgi:Cu/Ag efflux pump CusA